MLKQGIIDVYSSPWSSPVVLVKKKDRTTRLCADYRKLNAIIHKDSYLLPCIDDVLDSLSGVTSLGFFFGGQHFTTFLCLVHRPRPK